MSLYAPANEPFTSNTGQFTQTSYNGDPTGTLTISGGVGTYYYSGSSYSSAWFLDTNYAVTVPSFWVSIDIVSLPLTTGSYITVDVGIMKSDGQNELIFDCGNSSSLGSSYGFTAYDIDSGGKNIISGTFVTANPDTRGVPQAIGMRMINRQFQGWVKYNGVWELKFYGITTKDYTYSGASGVLSGYYGGFNIWGNNPPNYTVEVTNLRFGLGYDPSSYYQAVILGDTPVAYVPGNEYSGTIPGYIADIVLGYGNGWGSTEQAIPGSSCLAPLGAQAIHIDNSSGIGGIAFTNPVYTTNQAQLSMEMWINSTQTLGSAYGMVGECAGVFSDISGYVSNDWGMALSGNMQVSVGYGTSSSSDQNFLDGTANNNGSWHHLVATINPTTGAWALYVDGNLSSSGTGATGPSRAGNSYWWCGANAQSLNALVCNLAIYPSVLTAAQVRNHYIAGFAGLMTIGVAF